jgi:outer membrane protein OmpA-like peptidoglycan-associated protein
MTRLAVPIVILLLMLFGGAVWMLNAYLDLPDSTPTVEKSRSAKEAIARDETIKDLQTELTDKPAETLDDSKGSFDVARIDPNGTSVFAGRAAPGANVTIVGDGQELGTAQADENGEWTFATEHQFANADPKLALVVKSPAEAAKEAADRTKVASAEQRETAPGKTPEGRPSAKAVTKNLMKNLEGMVEAARSAPQPTAPDATGKQAAAPQAAPSTSPPAGSPPAAASRSAGPQDSATAKPPATLPAKQGAPSTEVAAAPLPPQADPAQNRTVVPVPITFVFNEASFTDSGKKAAGLLLEYLRLKQFKSVSLTGHADERGTEDLNMDLSRERLETVSHFLKEGGFKGELDLEPKGETEPFKGVDRSQYGKEDLFQLDRRVELEIKN